MATSNRGAHSWSIVWYHKHYSQISCAKLNLAGMLGACPGTASVFQNGIPDAIRRASAVPEFH